jgi:hypothetical protein
MKTWPLSLILILTLPACAGLWQKTTALIVLRGENSRIAQLRSGGQDVAALDSTTAAQRAAATAGATAGQGGQVLGVVPVALGSPAQQGLWLKSGLVAAPRAGRVMLQNGAGVDVTLLPGTGGATLSLAAYRALGLGLTDLPLVQVQALP